MGFVYNADGVRVQQITEGGVIDYEVDIMSPLPLPLVMQDGTYSYVYGLDLIASIDGSGTEVYHLYDGLGSVSELTDDSGVETDSYVYDAFGGVTSSTGSTSNDWLFTGEQNDGETELYFLRARYYDPDTGRFLGRDPIEFAQRYAYAGNNPATYTDPSGLCVLGLPCPTRGDLERELDQALDAARDDLAAIGDTIGEHAPRIRADLIEQARSAFSVFEPSVQEAQRILRAMSNDELGFAQLEGEVCRFFCGTAGIANPTNDVDPHGILGLGLGTRQQEVSLDLNLGGTIRQGATCQVEANFGWWEYAGGFTVSESNGQWDYGRSLSTGPSTGSFEPNGDGILGLSFGCAGVFRLGR